VEQETESIEVENNESAHRFEARVDGHLAFVQYRYSDSGDLVIAHTEVPAALGGRGIGSKLARAALEYARGRKLSVMVTCPFISSYIKKHPEYQPLVDTGPSE
jgi:predicted GNAT family acetyltransferase